MTYKVYARNKETNEDVVILLDAWNEQEAEEIAEEEYQWCVILYAEKWTMGD